MARAVPDRRCATVNPVPLGVEVLLMMVSRRSSVAVVAVALAAWKIPDVPKLAPLEDAFRLMLLK